MRHDPDLMFLSGKLAFALAFLGLVGTSGAQEEDHRPSSEMSRQMKLGVHFYEKGEDIQAMDRFLDVLSKGDPSERALANEYINLITQRMNTGAKVPRRPPSLRPQEAFEEATVPGRAPPPEEIPPELSEEGPPLRRPPSPRPPEAAQPTRDKAAMRKEIKAKLRVLAEQGLKDLGALQGLKVLATGGEPQAVGIPTQLLFQSGISFRKNAAKILEPLTRLVYAVGGAQVVILPEGTAGGDAKVLDMRRAMGVCAHLYSAGVAPPRVKVNLLNLNAQAEVPKVLSGFKGIVLLFLHDKSLGLASESPAGGEGPQISLGVFPPSFRPREGDGVVIEFSVQEPPEGLASWRFELLKPSPEEGRDLAPLQEVGGTSPVFHQVYWNGRQGYFGSALPAGRYECVLTAVDGKGRRRTLHRWIELRDEAPAAEARLSPQAAPAVGAPSPEIPGEPGLSEPLVKQGAPRMGSVEIRSRRGKAAAGGRKAARLKAASRRRQAPPAERTQATGGEAQGERAQDIQLPFDRDSHQMTQETQRRLAGVAEALSSRPRESVRISGLAHSAETDAAALAERRAQMVAGLLINKHQADPKRIQVTSSVSEEPASRVEIRFTRGE